MKHTPGPWTVTVNPRDHVTPYQIKGARGSNQDLGHVCNVFMIEGRKDHYAANAQLIASAPELLDLLKRIEALMAEGMPVHAGALIGDDETPVYQELTALISKATGGANE